MKKFTELVESVLNESDKPIYIWVSFGVMRANFISNYKDNNSNNEIDPARTKILKEIMSGKKDPASLIKKLGYKGKVNDVGWLSGIDNDDDAREETSKIE